MAFTLPNGRELVCATGGRCANTKTAVASNRIRYESRHSVATGKSPLKYIRLVYGNYIVDGSVGGTEVNTGNAVTIECSVEIPSAPTPGPIRVKFGGVAAATMPDGAADFYSDVIPASAFGLTTIPAGTVMWIKDSFLVSTGQNIPYGTGWSYATGEGAYQSAAASAQVMTSGVLTLPSGGVVSTHKSPMVAVVGAFTSTVPSLFIFGDSILDRQLDSYSNGLLGAGGGFAVRACYDPATEFYLPHTVLAVGGGQAVVTASNMAKRLKIAKYCTHGFVNYATNDIGTAGASAAAILAANKLIWAAMKATGIKVEQMQLLPRVTGSVTSLGGQVHRAGFGPGSTGETVRANNVANVGSDGLDAVLDLNSVIAAGGDPWKWRFDGGVAYTDGTHPAAATAVPLLTTAMRSHYAGLSA